MTKDVLVSISGLHMAAEGMEGNEDEPIEVLSAGTYYFKNGKHYVLFEEVAEGISGVTKTQIKWQDTEFLEVSKKGLSNVHMIFEKNKKNVTYYYTPYGSLLIGIDAHKVQIEEQEDLIVVQVEYSLEVNCEHIANCNITVQIRPKGAFVKL